MAKKEIIKNDAVTVRVNTEPVVNAVHAVESVLEKPVQAVGDILSEAADVMEQTLDLLEEGVDQTQRVFRTNPWIVAGVAVTALAVGGYIGYTVGVKRTRLKYEEILTTEIEAAKDYYARVHKEGAYATPEAALETLVPEAAAATQRYSGRERAQRVDYNKISSVPETIAEQIVETIEVVKTHNVFEVVHESGPWDYALEIADREANPGNPYVVSYEEYVGNEVNHDQQTLTYYAGDDTLADMRDVPIDNTDYTVGDDNLTRFGHGSHDPNVVYIRNERSGSDYEVIRSEGTFEQEVMGVKPGNELRHSDRPARKWRSERE